MNDLAIGDLKKELEKFLREGISKGKSTVELKSYAVKKEYPEQLIDSVIGEILSPQKTKSVYNISNTNEEERPLWKEIFGISESFVFPLAWTLTFMVVGISLQSIQANSLVFMDFFGKNLMDWFHKFNGFIAPQTYPSFADLARDLASGWYYFAFVGGLISLVWVILYSLLKLAFKRKK